MVIIDKYKELFSKKLKFLMDKKEISNNKLANDLGVERSTITQYINGDVTPKIDTFLALCEILDVKPEYFLDDEIKFKDYYNLKEKSRARKIIESMYILSSQNILVKNPELFMTENERYRINYDGYLFINEIIETCIDLSKRDILENIDVCEIIVNKYEKELTNLLNEIRH